MSRYDAPCGHYATADGHCGATPTRRYLPGPRCAAHTPAALAGRPEPAPNPALTLAGLRRAAGLPDVAPLLMPNLIDDRAIASGKRRASPDTYREASAREEARRHQQKGS